MYRFIFIIKDKLSGMFLEESLVRNDEIDKFDLEEDFNKFDDEIFRRKKLIMEDIFEKNLKKSGDSGFEYDV